MGVAYQACDVWHSLGCQSMNDSPYLLSSNQWPTWPLMGKCDLTRLSSTASLTDYLDLRCADLPIAGCAAGFAALGIRRLGVWLWHDRPMVDLCATCQRHGCLIRRRATWWILGTTRGAWMPGSTP
jgi:hypothetical protein